MTKRASILDKIAYPSDLRAMGSSHLREIADALRAEMIDAVSFTGGHLGSGLGVVELTVALHYVFDTPKDQLIWDVGHQAYPHKILTGRRDRIRTIRQGGGLSGFTKRKESPYDVFGAGHSSTSISAALGIALARDLSREHYKVVAVIGDGAISAGMAYEALNNAGGLKSSLLVILNDNEMSIAPPVGAMAHYLSRLTSNASYVALRDTAKKVGKLLPEMLRQRVGRAEEFARGFLVDSGTMFEELGFRYFGPIDGHDLDQLVPILENLRDHHEGPVLLHVVTKKGKGYDPAEASPDRYHGVVKFDVMTGRQNKTKANAPSYTQVFGTALTEMAKEDQKIVAITAAMPSGTGIDLFEKQFPERTFDVGIAEQHAVTFAAGLATQGYKPFVAIYSTFLQRAYDQIVHDVAIQNLPVRFCIDRAGLVGADGPTHAGSFDLCYLLCLPNFVVMAPSDEEELMHMLVTAQRYDHGPIAIRYPRGEGVGLDLPERGSPLEIGKARVVLDTKDAEVGIIALGTRVQEALKAAQILKNQGVSVRVVDARFAKPVDETMLCRMAEEHRMILTIEEGSKHGFGAAVVDLLNQEGYLDTGNVIVRTMALPDTFLDHDSPQAMYERAELNASSIVSLVERYRDMLKSSEKQKKSEENNVVALSM